MPIDTPALDLPPGFTGVALREHGDAFAHAQTIAAEAGAGTLVHVRRYDLIEFAVVLEPDEPLASARRAHYASMVAMADAIAAHCPPERMVEFKWPDTILFDGGLIGGARLAWPQSCAEDQVPDWLVTGLILRTADLAHVETGLVPGAVSLLSEGFELIDTEMLIGSYARHFLHHTSSRLVTRARKPRALRGPYPAAHAKADRHCHQSRDARRLSWLACVQKNPAPQI